MYENLLPRFLRYVKTETRSDATSNNDTINTNTSSLCWSKRIRRIRDERCYL